MMMNMLMIPGSIISKNYPKDVFVRSLYGGGKYYITGGTNDFSINYISDNEIDGIVNIVQDIFEKIQKSS